MTTPETNDPDTQESAEPAVPAANPAYATPPPQGLPDADNN
ncbi:hypothetical protein [Mycolicibacterium mengxianglii]|nr:hypothetical protein [Mycolicibacterium mengxianglii]